MLKQLKKEEEYWYIQEKNESHRNILREYIPTQSI